MARRTGQCPAVDRRADIWAFGCALYEMLTGRRAFDADDVSLTMARALERDVDLEALPADVPPRVRQTLSVCLRKDPRQRAGGGTDIVRPYDIAHGWRAHLRAGCSRGRCCRHGGGPLPCGSQLGGRAQTACAGELNVVRIVTLLRPGPWA
jgi:serine/threonine protein kinase